MAQLKSRKGKPEQPFVVGELVLAGNDMRRKLSIQTVERVERKSGGMWEVTTRSSEPDKYPGVTALSLVDGEATCISKLKRTQAEKLLVRLDSPGERYEMDPNYRTVLAKFSETIPKTLQRLFDAYLPIEIDRSKPPITQGDAVLVFDTLDSTLSIQGVGSVVFDEVQNRWMVETETASRSTARPVRKEMDADGGSAVMARLDPVSVDNFLADLEFTHKKRLTMNEGYEKDMRALRLTPGPAIKAMLGERKPQIGNDTTGL